MPDLDPDLTDSPATGDWTLLTPHAMVLVSMLDNPQVRIRDLAARVGLTERSVARIILALVRDGVISRRKSGRRNSYFVNRHLSARHALETHDSVRRLAGILSATENSPAVPG